MSAYISYPSATGAGVPVYAAFSSLPATASVGDLAVTADTGVLYEWRGSSWAVIGGPGAALSVGTFDSGVASADGAHIDSNALIMQSASATVPGLVNTSTQTFAGAKTFTGAISASNLSGTNTGDVTIGTSNGLSLASQVLSLQLSSTSTTGALSSADWNTFNGKQPSGNYITALTGDATASGPGSAALTLATVNSNVGSFGSVSASAIFTVNAKGLITAASSSAIQIAESQVTNLVSDLSGKQPTGNYITALTGDVAASGPGSAAATIQAGAVTLSKMASLAANSIIGNNTGSPATPIALTAAQVNALLGTLSNPMTTLGDTIYGGASGAATRLAGDTSNTRKFYREQSSGGVATAPVWDTLVAGDIPNLAASIITSGTLATARGGTNLDTSASTGVAKVASGTWSVATIVNADISSSAAIATSKIALTAPKYTALITTDTQTGWLFTISTSTTCAVNDTYTNNGHTYTVQGALSAQSGQVLWMSGTGATSGTTLTRATGSGTASITFSANIATATYTVGTSPSPISMHVKLVGGGGGGAGGGNTPTVGGAGTFTGFGPNLVMGPGGGGGGTVGNSPSAPGTGSVATGVTGLSGQGWQGSYGGAASAVTLSSGGNGGASCYGGAGGGGAGNGSAGTNGTAAGANTGSGGGGAGSGNTTGASGGGGSSGGCAEAWFTGSANIAASYPYIIGGLGSAGTHNGGNGSDGANGGVGYIEITEYYQ